MTAETVSAAAGRPSPGVVFEREQGVTHLSARSGLARMSVYVDAPRAAMREVFDAVAEAGLNVYLIKIHENWLSFAVSAEDTDAAIAVCEAMDFRCALARSCAIVSVVAPAMRDLSGVLWRIIACMREAGVDVLELADAYNAVSCLIHQEELQEALDALGRTFGVELVQDDNPLDPW